jgi:platelet-activating factor acetylhydrolase IB subunit alpha
MVRVWSFSSGECKLQLREHEHVVEHVAWAPAASSPAINTLVTGDVSLYYQ